MNVYDPYTNTFYDNSKKQDVITSDKTIPLGDGNLCDSCMTKSCIFQYGIVRSHCDFYKAESEVSK